MMSVVSARFSQRGPLTGKREKFKPPDSPIVQVGYAFSAFLAVLSEV